MYVGNVHLGKCACTRGYMWACAYVLVYVCVYGRVYVCAHLSVFSYKSMRVGTCNFFLRVYVCECMRVCVLA
jgi:hypothetical protein